MNTNVKNNFQSISKDNLCLKNSTINLLNDIFFILLNTFKKLQK